MHPPAVRAEALRLSAQGLPDREVADELGLGRRTVSDWRRGVARPRKPPEAVCPRCWRGSRSMSFTPGDYAFLLGMYLGDGNISRLGRTHTLRITLDARYPRIVDETAAVLARCLHRNRVNRVRKDGGSAIVVVAHSGHMPCLFPQHGPGKKHERDVSLEAWQQDIADLAPWSLLRGLLWSDGCSFVNRTGRYEYLSWHFSNRSPDIRALFARTCEAMGIAHREYADHFRINRRACSELLRQHVGVKA